MEINILRKKDNKEIQYKKINHITFGEYSFGLHRWNHIQNLKKDSSEFFNYKEYIVINIIDTMKGV